jgi:hypothetical protein
VCACGESYHYNTGDLGLGRVTTGPLQGTGVGRYITGDGGLWRGSRARSGLGGHCYDL